MTSIATLQPCSPRRTEGLHLQTLMRPKPASPAAVLAQLGDAARVAMLQVASWPLTTQPSHDAIVRITYWTVTCL